MRALGIWPILVLASAGIAFAQGGGPTFEVASVKPSTASERLIGLFTYPGGRITVNLYTLEMLIEAAFDVQAFQIAGGPGWMRADRYDIDARPPASSKSSKANPPYRKAPPNEEQRHMLQALLVDRFQLKFHRTTADAAVYLLEKGNGALRMQPAADNQRFPWAGVLPTGFKGEDISLPQLAVRLSGWLERPVIDRTGMEGSFDFKAGYEFADPDHPDVVSCVVTSIREIGLRLVAARGVVEKFVVDYAEKPSEN